MPCLNTKHTAAKSITEGQHALNNNRELFIITVGTEVIGAVQLSLCSKANGAHRGEIEKLMVHSQHQGQGFAKQLMNTLEQSALQQQLTLLVLDTRLGDVASRLYHKLNYIEAGQIPQFALSSSGELNATVYFYKPLL
ncbi:GNAT family N-acetyltransferase [Pseudoalteromonas sp. NEC-BIFX-2020_002]|nr:GNAT family N-acetyltransferase [Pseudoalteromonas sp. NEC-BIFX-2020_002]NNG43278.1 GNAT family N-acetyltransferase [Pseudoalteromonas sp. NEC-BIFX-2020_002]